jgi:hypothetical protein
VEELRAVIARAECKRDDVTNSSGRLGIGEFRREETMKKENKKKIILVAAPVQPPF